MTAETDKALTEREAAARLGISPITLGRWRRDGAAPVLPLPGLGRLVRYAESAIVKYFDGGGALTKRGTR